MIGQFPFPNLGIFLLELRLVNETLFDLLDWMGCQMGIPKRLSRAANLPFLLCVPSGRLAGPTVKPLLCLFAGAAGSSSRCRFAAIM